MKPKIRLGARPSKLAIRQAEEIALKLPGYAIEIVPIETLGDKDKVTSFLDGVRDDFFTKEIEEKLASGVIDAAVHSAKDLEDKMPEGLAIACMTRSVSPFECLVSKDGHCLKDLPKGSRVATSSAKRKEALKCLRPDLGTVSVRGNIDERLAKMDNGEFDALLVAHAALIRLGYEDRIAEIFPKEVMEPHPLQGMLAVQVRRDRQEIFDIFKGLNDA